jgi:xanthine dehydrogenase accessory factor
MASFAEAVYRGEYAVEGVTARRVADLGEAYRTLDEGLIPVMVDPECKTLQQLQSPPHASRFAVLVDGRMTKQPPGLGKEAASLVVGLGPGFVAGENCHAVVETKRGHFMGCVIWNGSAEVDTGIPEGVLEHAAERALRAPAEGVLETLVEIGDHLEAGQAIAEVDGKKVLAPFPGMLRGLLHPGLVVRRGLKIGDLDPRDDPRYCALVSDKSLAVGGGVLEAILSQTELRPHLWE